MQTAMYKEANPIFIFWFENKTAQERKFYLSDLRRVFQKWLLKKDIEWLKYYDTYMVVLSFITEKEGLNSTHKNSEIDKLVKMLKPDYRNIINGINPVTKLPM